MRKAMFPTAFVRVLTAVAFALAAVLAAAGSATASSTQPTMLQDDAQLVLGSQAQRDARLDEFKRLGVDIVKVRLSWRGVAPSNTSRRKPSGFDGADPAAYPAGAWDPYDAIVRGAEARGLRVFFQLGGNAPEWATPGKRRSAVYRPNATEFRAFVRAVGTRYSGTYGGSGGGPAPAPPGGGGLPVPLPGVSSGEASAAQAGDAIPRVSLYSVWNEPNLNSWLAPQRAKGAPASPAIYRRLLYGAADGLSQSGHGNDELLLGELLPYVGTGRGSTRTRPLAFLRELACVKRNFRSYRGKAAKKRGCAGRFRKLPGTGLAFHPYTLGGGPNIPVRNRDDASIATLSRVTKTLDRMRGRLAAGRGMPLWITEFGFQSRPPDPFATPLRKVPGFMAQSERIAWGNKRVASFSQYPLVDDRGRNGFQSGLRFANGKAKPRVYKAFQHTIYVRRLSGSRVEVFGAERAADSGNVTIERKRGKGRWRRVATVAVNDAGYFRRNVSGSSSDSFRFRYGSATSRAAKPARR